MSKALMEKAFNEWIKYRAGLDKYSAMSAWQAGATWQREQLEAEKNKLIKDIEICRKATNGTDDYSVGMRNGMEVILCTLEKREPRMDNCLPRTNNLSEREQLEAEIEKLKNINKVMNDQLMKNSVADLTGVVKDIKTQDPREQLIKELRRWIFVEYVPVFDRLVVDKDKLLAKLDLLEKGNK